MDSTSSASLYSHVMDLMQPSSSPPLPTLYKNDQCTENDFYQNASPTQPDFVFEPPSTTVNNNNSYMNFQHPGFATVELPMMFIPSNTPPSASATLGGASTCYPMKTFHLVHHLEIVGARNYIPQIMLMNPYDQPGWRNIFDVVLHNHKHSVLADLNRDAANYIPMVMVNDRIMLDNGPVRGLPGWRCSMLRTISTDYDRAITLEAGHYKPHKVQTFIKQQSRLDPRVVLAHVSVHEKTAAEQSTVPSLASNVVVAPDVLAPERFNISALFVRMLAELSNDPNFRYNIMSNSEIEGMGGSKACTVTHRFVHENIYTEVTNCSVCNQLKLQQHHQHQQQLLQQQHQSQFVSFVPPSRFQAPVCSSSSIPPTPLPRPLKYHHVPITTEKHLCVGMRLF